MNSLQSSWKHAYLTVDNVTGGDESPVETISPRIGQATARRSPSTEALSAVFRGLNERVQRLLIFGMDRWFSQFLVSMVE